MANVYQQAVKQRKLIYLGSMVVLLLASLAVRGSFFRIKSRSQDEVKASPTLAMTIDGRAKVHELTELQQGDKELGGAAIQLLLTGSRGLAVSALWLNAIEKQREHEWNELDISVNSITKLQPHFTAPWLFQSWNLTYNVSVEMDRLDDMYFYIARGISVIAEGESLNRNNPDLRYNIGFYYQNKFGVSDRVTTLRCLYQLSCIPEEDRDPERLMTVAADGTKTINAAAFEDFCRAHPQLVRRMKETRIPVDGSDKNAQALAAEPMAVVNFLRNNRKVPSRYQPGTKELQSRLKQFPVLPDFGAQTDSYISSRELDFKATLADHEQDAFLVSRAWYALANTSLPPPTQKPNNDGTYNPDPLKYRVPKRPATIIFRQGPMRAQSYLAERLTKEGWFDLESWAIDELAEGVLTDPDQAWIPKVGPDGRRISARFTTPMSAQQAWQEAARRWQEHGIANGLRMEPTKLQRYIADAEEFCKFYPGLSVGDNTPPLTPQQEEDERIRNLREAHEIVRAWMTNQHMTNYENFEVEATAMMTDEAMLAYKRFHQADKAVRDAVRYSDAVRLFNEGFDAWKQVLVARQDCRHRRATGPSIATQKCRDFRDIDKHQEFAYERNVRYIKLAQDVRQRELRGATLWLHDLVSQAGIGSVGNPFSAALNLNVLANEINVVRGKQSAAEVILPQLKAVTPFPLPGPLDGLAPDGTEWVDPDLKTRVREKLGLIKKTQAPAESTGDPDGHGHPTAPPAPAAIDGR